MKLSLIIPAHNEENRIEPTLKSYRVYFDALKKKGTLDYEIIVVINGTKDRTEDVVKKVMRAHRTIHYLNLVQGGKGYAVIEGFKVALKNNSDLIGFVDADGSTPPQAFHFLIEHLGNADGAIASRYIRGSSVSPKQTFMHILSSRIYNMLIRILFFMPYRDTQCGAKLFRRKAVETTIASFTMASWAFDIDLLYNMRKRKCSIIELPTLWGDAAGSKRDTLKTGTKMALGVIKLRLINSPFSLFLDQYYRMFPSRAPKPFPQEKTP